MLRPDFIRKHWRLLRHWPVALALGIWLQLFSKLYANGKIVLFADGRSLYVYTDFFLNKILRGVYPLWNPFDGFGRPDGIWAREINEYNPLLLINTLLQGAGLNVNLSFFIYLAILFSLACLGFYFLAQVLFKRLLLSQLATLLLIFSSLGQNAFNDTIIITLLFPCGWFFGFLTIFFQKPSAANFLGSVFFLVLIATTYLPLYFAAICAALLISLLITRAVPVHFGPVITFLSQQRTLAWSGLLFFLAGLFPILLWGLVSSNNDLLIAGRSESLIKLPIGVASGQNIIHLNDLRGLFSGIEALPYNNFFAPVILIIIPAIAAFYRISRLTFGLALTWAIIFLITLGDCSPVYVFLYEHVPFFRSFRNLHFLSWLSYPCLALAAASVAASLRQGPMLKKPLLPGYFVLTALVPVAFLLSLGGISPWTWLSVGFGLVFTALLSFRPKWPVFIFQGILFLAISFQSVSFLSSQITAVASPGNAFDLRLLKKKVAPPAFSYERPEASPDNGLRGFGDTEDEARAPRGYLVTQWANSLRTSVDQAGLNDYVRHKFILYSRTEPPSFPDAPDQLPKDIFSLKRTAALIDRKDDEQKLTTPFFPPKVLAKEGPSFRVSKFDYNSLTLNTNFVDPVFLVYTDSYSKYWQLKIDGKNAALFRANYAFKGFWIPAGPHTIELDYGPPFTAQLFLLTMLTTWGLAGIVLYLLLKDRRQHRLYYVKKD